MTVCVVIPSQGKRDTLLETIGSLIKQTRKPDEIIIRLKEEGTGSHIQGYFKLNEAVRQTDCDSFIPLCDDDLLDERFIEETLKVMEEQNADCVYTKMKTFGEEVGEHFPNHEFPFITALFRKSIWEKLGGYRTDAGMYADSLFGRQVFKQGKVIFVEKPLFIYRVHKDQETQNVTKEQGISEYAKLTPYL